MKNNVFEEALNLLGNEFNTLKWDFRKLREGKGEEVISYWPGNADEDIMVCVLKSRHFHEPFHRQDFFFLNYAYQSGYCTESSVRGNLITIPQEGCYIGQPYSGYALQGNVGSSEPEIIIVGILIKRQAFFEEYLPILSSNATMFDFFIRSQRNLRSDAFLQVSFENDMTIRRFIEMFVIEYAFKHEDTQNILKSMFMTLLTKFERNYRLNHVQQYSETTLSAMDRYMTEHLDKISLKEMAAYYSYHPNYLSAYLRKETGETFSEMLLRKRMERALILMQRTKLPVQDIAHMVGYNDLSNFYKAFKKYHHATPCEKKRDV